MHKNKDIMKKSMRFHKAFPVKKKYIKKTQKTIHFCVKDCQMNVNNYIIRTILL